MHVTHQGQGYQARDARAPLSALARLPLQSQRTPAPRHTRHCPAQVQDRNLTMCTQSQPTRCDYSTLRVTICCAHYRNRKAAFINGCFWHGHEGCRYYVPPKSNSQFWQQKIERNKQRDIEKRIQLRLLGWHTIIIWECQLKPKQRYTTLQALEQTLNKIFLLNNGAKVIADYSYEEENIGMVAEGENSNI